MHRAVISLLVGAALAIPAGYTLAQTTDEDGSMPVPASECPGAVAVLEAAGHPSPDTFWPDCPDTEELAAFTQAGVPVLDRAEACLAYVAKPEWCPTSEEVAAAQAATAGEASDDDDQELDASVDLAPSAADELRDPWPHIVRLC